MHLRPRQRSMMVSFNLVPSASFRYKRKAKKSFLKVIWGRGWVSFLRKLSIVYTPHVVLTTLRWETFKAFASAPFIDLLQTHRFWDMFLNHNQKQSLHKKWSFPLTISSVNVTKSAVSRGFGNIYWRNY